MSDLILSKLVVEQTTDDNPVREEVRTWTLEEIITSDEWSRGEIIDLLTGNLLGHRIVEAEFLPRENG